MNRTIRAIVGAGLVLVIVFSAISITQNIGRSLKLDITEHRLYVLSDGTKSILRKLNQPIKAKLYYAKTAALKGPDQIRFFNNYYEYVRALLGEYVSASNGMVELEIIDPRPFSDDEAQAMKYGLRRFPITEEESFFFGMVMQTQFGVEKAIPFFSPDRQKFVEYDISYLIDTAVTRQKRKIGVLSSLPVMGDDVTGYMRDMMMRQGQQPRPAWTFVEQLRKQFEVETVATDVNDINDIDILLVIHPKGLAEQTLFAIDQYVLKGGRTIVCVDPHCFMDRPPQQMQMQMRMQHASNSDLNPLLKTWGLEMPANTFAGDRNLAAMVRRGDQRPEKIIGYLGLTPEGNCFAAEHVVTAELNEVMFAFSGVLNEIVGSNDANDVSPAIERTPLIRTSSKGNTFTISGPYELMFLDGASLMRKFVDGAEPVSMGYLVTGRLKSSFPDGIEVESESPDPNDPNETITTTTQVAGLTEAEEDCAVIVFSDVDFISDGVAYQNSIFGPMVRGDNSTLMLNAIEDLGGSSDLVSIRSRGNFKRPFEVVDKIEKEAEAETAKEVERRNLEIASLQSKLQDVLNKASKEGQEKVIDDAIVKTRKDLEVNLRQAQRELRQVRMAKRERIERLGNKLRQANMLGAPAVILAIAIVLGLRRSVRKRHYISHASDA